MFNDDYSLPISFQRKKLAGPTPRSHTSQMATRAFGLNLKPLIARIFIWIVDY
ncbi:hypothetical protein [Paraburkholderia sp. RL17-337-BIB-A]|uniref:hypothetical protein n=1 Tax=Paraburkholderia sp. RL17-337-BIB-A TaxID=3031636 RepID=UPI0038B86778